MAHQNTFAPEHWDGLVSIFAGFLPTSAMETLWKASHSESFGEDLRALIAEVVRPERIEEWS